MKVLVLTDERLIRDRVVRDIRERFSDVTIIQNTINNPVLKVQKYVEITGRLDYLFWELPSRVIAKESVVAEIKHQAPGVRLVCCFHGAEYISGAIRYIDGVLLRPVLKQDIFRVMEENRSGHDRNATNGKPQIRVQTFGNFDVFVDGKLLTFERNKAKELFAYLIDRKGAGAATSEIAAVLWEDREYSKGILSQTTRTISILRKVLEQNGIGDVLVK